MKKNVSFLRVIIPMLFFISGTVYCNAQQLTTKTTKMLQPDAQTINKLTELVYALPSVQRKSKIVDSVSNHKRKLSCMVMYADGTKKDYQVNVGEDNEMGRYDYYHFLIDAKTLKILTPKGDYEK